MADPVSFYDAVAQKAAHLPSEAGIVSKDKRSNVQRGMVLFYLAMMANLGVWCAVGVKILVD